MVIFHCPHHSLPCKVGSNSHCAFAPGTNGGPLAVDYCVVFLCLLCCRFRRAVCVCSCALMLSTRLCLMMWSHAAYWSAAGMTGGRHQELLGLPATLPTWHAHPQVSDLYLPACCHVLFCLVTPAHTHTHRPPCYARAERTLRCIPVFCL